MSQIYL